VTRRVEFTAGFDRLFRRLPKELRLKTYEKLALFLEDPSHPSLRVKKMKGTDAIWEMSVTMNYRITFEVDGERVLLRRIATHDVLREP
jgi:mRNA-degrading endonuclease RelE of RelBE toxin-antitoxin system